MPLWCAPKLPSAKFSNAARAKAKGTWPADCISKAGLRLEGHGWKPAPHPKVEFPLPRQSVLAFFVEHRQRRIGAGQHLKRRLLQNVNIPAGFRGHRQDGISKI